jgi:hypothetical protein
MAAPLALVLAGCVSFNAPKVEVEERSTVATDSGLRVQELFVGDGEPVETGDVVTFDYTMWLADGARVDSTQDRGTPLIGQEECARFVAERRIPLAKLITHRFKLDQAPEAYRLFDTQTTGKGVFVF